MNLPTAEQVANNIFTIFILLAFFFFIYTAIKKQSLIDTWEDIKELFGG